MAIPTTVQSSASVTTIALKDQFTIIWNKAIDDFNRESNTDAASIWLPQLKDCSMKQLCQKIEGQNKGYKTFVKHRAAIFDSLNAFLRPVQVFSKVAGAGAQIVS